jgi:hypothetical protein
MQIIASYTWARAIDDASSDTAVNSPPLRGYSDNDIRQVLNAAVNYEIPRATSSRLLRALTTGWSLDNRFTAQTGVPVLITQSYYTLQPGDIFGTVFPDLVPGVPVVLRNVPGDPFGWALNPAAFKPVPLNPDGSPVRQGNLPRNYVHGPAFWNLTTAAQRNFSLSERWRLVFRVEAFNIFNHPNASNPNGCLCDGPLFGLIEATGQSLHGVNNALYATGGPRSLQLTLKLQF